MKVLLCEDVALLGWLGDVVDVKEGYARNYLIPQGIAQMATESNIKAIADEKAKRAELRIREEKHIEEAAKKVEGAEAVIAAKANEQGHLFGSVGPKEIAENLRAQGYQVANEIVHLQENIKQVGTHQVSLKFTDELIVSVQVTVVAESPDEEQKET